MVQAGVGGLDTPRTNLGDATYLTNQLDFDISQEQSFQSPSKDNNNLLQQLQNGRHSGATVNLRTPRNRAALSDRRNRPVGLGVGGEFTPLLKSATRNSALQVGKENGIPHTPAFLRPGGLEDVPEELSPMPALGSSIYGRDSGNGSYVTGTPMPQMDNSSVASTPLAILSRRNEGPGVLQDGNQLSLREQENVIDKIEKENFGLKLKIHFLEEALRKAGPGFSQEALKENTELKVDKVTMQKELHRYRKTLGVAERDVELYRQQILEMQEKVKRRHVDEGQQEELERLKQIAQEKESDISRLKRQVEVAQANEQQLDNMHDKVEDLEADLRERDRLVDDRDDELDSLKTQLEEHQDAISRLEESLKKAQHRAIELEEESESSGELANAKVTIDELEHEVQTLKSQMDAAEEERQEAVLEKQRAMADLEELQDEMANRSVTTKGLSRQVEEKANRLQDDLENLQEKYNALNKEYDNSRREDQILQERIADLIRDNDLQQQKLRDQLDLMQNEGDIARHERDSFAAKVGILEEDLAHSLEKIQAMEAESTRLRILDVEVQRRTEEKELLQTRHDALTSESASLQRDLAQALSDLENLDLKLKHEKALALNNEQNLHDKYRAQIDHLNEEINDVRQELRNKERVLADDNDKWNIEKRSLEGERDIAIEKAAGLQRTIDSLQQVGGTFSNKELKNQEALQVERDRYESQQRLLSRQIEELNNDVQARRSVLEETRKRLEATTQDLRMSLKEQTSLREKVEGLEDEIEILQNSLDDESDQAKQDRWMAKQESEELKIQVQQLKSKPVIAELPDSVSATHNRLESLLKHTEAQLAIVRQEKQALQDQLSTSNLDIHSLRLSKSRAEAERDEMGSQLEKMQQQKQENFTMDEERVGERTAKSRLDKEIRRLRDEIKLFTKRQQAMEIQLQKQISQAGAEEDRLRAEINNLKERLQYDTGKEPAAATEATRNFQNQNRGLESQLITRTQPDITSQLETARQALHSAQKRETEYVQRDGAQKEVLQGLTRQIKELEHHDDNDASQLSLPSPRTSGKSSTRSEAIDSRYQLSIMQRTIKDLRTQLKEVERNSAYKLQNAANELEAQGNALEAERNSLQLDLNDAIFQRDQLSSKNAAAETTINKLKSKIERLEKELRSERLNSGEDRTIALERRDLHDMLRETQLQAESLEITIKERERTIASAIVTERALREKLGRVREERAIQRSQVAYAQEQNHALERKLALSKETWEDEKRALTRGVRFPNMSVSEAGNESMIKQVVEQREVRHGKELRGLAMQIEYLRASLVREQNLRANAAHIKLLLEGKIDFLKSCNQADSKLLGIGPRVKIPKKRTLKHVATMVLGAVRMKQMAVQWQKNRAINDRLQACLKEMRKKQGRRINGTA